MRLQLIAEGSTGEDRLARRWGLSFLLGEEVLFDAFGDEKVFLENISKFKIDTGRIRHIVISHDDWDHIAGLWYLMEKRKDLRVYICPNAGKQFKERIRTYGVEVVEAGAPVKIADGIYTSGELTSPGADSVIYEQSLAVKTDRGVSVICGCAHPGVISIISSVKNIYKKNADMLIGGLHLKDTEEEAVLALSENMRKAGINRVLPLHCTGKEAVRIMQNHFGPGFLKMKEGEAIEI